MSRGATDGPRRAGRKRPWGKRLKGGEGARRGRGRSVQRGGHKRRAYKEDHLQTPCEMENVKLKNTKNKDFKILK